jgi:hypothetical protein
LGAAFLADNALFAREAFFFGAAAFIGGPDVKRLAAGERKKPVRKRRRTQRRGSARFPEQAGKSERSITKVVFDAQLAALPGELPM